MDLETLAAELHAAYNAEHLRQFPGDTDVKPFADLPDRIKDYYRAVARRAMELLAHARTITVTTK